MAPVQRHLLPRRLVLSLGAVAGVALAHVLGYLMVIPGRAQRAELLTDTGHGWYHVAALGGVAGALAVIGAFWCGLHQRSRTSGRDARSVPLFTDVWSVALLQVALFGAIETIERVLTHEPVADLLHSRLLFLGLTLQVVVACVVVTVLRAAEQAAARLSFGSPPSTCSPSQRLFEARSAAPSHSAPERPDCRGPPLGSVRFTT